MNLLYAASAFLLAAAARAGRRHPGRRLADRAAQPAGRQLRRHRRHAAALCACAAPAGADLPPIVFIHGASANLNDQMLPLQAAARRPRRAAVPRPAGPWLVGARPATTRRRTAQAATIAALMEHLGIGQAIIVGHSFGGVDGGRLRARSIPKRRAGLVFLAAATHPWPGGSDLLVLPADGHAGRRPAVFRDASPIRPARGAHAAGARAASSRPTRCRTTISRTRLDPAGAEAAAVPRQCHRRRRASIASHSRNAPRYQRDRGADRGHLGRQRHGRLRGDPLARAGARHPGRRTGLGATISATSRTGSRPTSSSRRSRSWRAGRAICRRWRGASRRGSPATLTAPASASTRSRRRRTAQPDSGDRR